MQHEENHLFDKLASSDQHHFALKEDEMKMNGNAMGRTYRNGSPIKRAIKRNSKNIGYSNSFNVSADIRRKLFVNRYKEWSLQASKKPGSNIDISSIPIQKRFSDLSDESHTSFPTSNTPLIKETNNFSFELSNEVTQNTETDWSYLEKLGKSLNKCLQHGKATFTGKVQFLNQALYNC